MCSKFLFEERDYKELDIITLEDDIKESYKGEQHDKVVTQLVPVAPDVD